MAQAFQERMTISNPMNTPAVHIVPSANFKATHADADQMLSAISDHLNDNYTLHAQVGNVSAPGLNSVCGWFSCHTSGQPATFVTVYNGDPSKADPPACMQIKDIDMQDKDGRGSTCKWVSSHRQW